MVTRPLPLGPAPKQLARLPAHCALWQRAERGTERSHCSDAGPYANERYDPAVFGDGEFFGPAVDGFVLAANLYLP